MFSLESWSPLFEGLTKAFKGILPEEETPEEEPDPTKKEESKDVVSSFFEHLLTESAESLNKGDYTVLPYYLLLTKERLLDLFTREHLKGLVVDSIQLPLYAYRQVREDPQFASRLEVMNDGVIRFNGAILRGGGKPDEVRFFSEKVSDRLLEERSITETVYPIKIPFYAAPTVCTGSKFSSEEKAEIKAEVEAALSDPDYAIITRDGVCADYDGDALTWGMDKQKEIAIDIGRAIHCTRIRKRMSLEALSESTSLGRELLLAAECGSELLSTAKLDRIAKALGIDAFALYEGRVIPVEADSGYGPLLQVLGGVLAVSGLVQIASKKALKAQLKTEEHMTLAVEPEELSDEPEAEVKAEATR